jgi:2-succinyl-6-hydroxy-2,4-cyclohexadiene-1-carboxylate synthase
MGARIALVLALQHPDAVGRLVLESPSAGLATASARAARAAADGQLADEIERDGVAAFVERWEAMPILASQAALAAEVRARQRRERLRHTPAGLAGSLRGAGQGAMPPLHHRLGQVAAPTLVIAGGLDATGLARAREVADGIPGARLAVVPDAGHSPHLEAPEAFASLVDDFIRTSQATH